VLPLATAFTTPFVLSYKRGESSATGCWWISSTPGQNHVRSNALECTAGTSPAESKFRWRGRNYAVITTFMSNSWEYTAENQQDLAGRWKFTPGKPVSAHWMSNLEAGVSQSWSCHWKGFAGWYLVRTTGKVWPTQKNWMNICLIHYSFRTETETQQRQNTCVADRLHSRQHTPEYGPIDINRTGKFRQKQVLLNSASLPGGWPHALP